MINKVKTFLIIGALGSGKTSLLRQLLQQKPETERWAILINEFGNIGLDKALLSATQDAIITEIAGGCLCCTNGAPFQVGLTKLLKEARPDVLFIELSGLGHPLQIQQQLLAEPWRHILSLQPLIQVIDVTQLSNKIDYYPNTGLLLINKAEQVTSAQRQKIIHQLASVPIYWTHQGYLPLSSLPKQQQSREAKLPLYFAHKGNSSQEQITLKKGVLCSIQEQQEGWAIGWQLEANYQFNHQKLNDWLLNYLWLRAKLVINTEQGWLSVNAVQNQAIIWNKTEWRKDNRIELIFTKKQIKNTMIDGLLGCLNHELNEDDIFE